MGKEILGSVELNRIYQMDCLEGMQLVPDQSVDILITDPPYTTPTVTSFGRKKARNMADFSIQETYLKLLKQQFERILKPNAPMFMFCDELYYPTIFKTFYDWNNVQMVIWDKGRIGMGKPFRKRHELIFYANRDSMETNQLEGLSHYPTVMNYKPITKDKLHGAQKPIELISDLLRGFSKEGDVVLDCFMGSGTTAAAAIKLNRKFIGFELSEEYVEIANKRLDCIDDDSIVCDDALPDEAENKTVSLGVDLTTLSDVLKRGDF